MKLTRKTFSQEEHKVWSIMYQRQRDLLASTDKVSTLFLHGLSLAPLSAHTIPDSHETSALLSQKNGRTLIDAENPYLSMNDRFAHLIEKRFPVTSYIRSFKDIDFTPLPDLFHEYFGHMPQMFIDEFAAIEHKTARLFYSLQTTEQKQQLYALSWYSIEYGAIMENGIPKAIGAGILSSPGDLQRFIDGEFELIPATLEQIITTEPSPHKPHKTLFVFDSLEQFSTILDEFEELILDTR